jgi:hypothetical protein
MNDPATLMLGIAALAFAFGGFVGHASGYGRGRSVGIRIGRRVGRRK